SLPESALLRGLERFLQPHSRSSQQIRARLEYLALGDGCVEGACGLQFGGAFRAAPQVLLQFVTSIVCELVINVEDDIFLYPITLHNCTPFWGYSFKNPSGARLASTHIRQRPTQFLRSPEEGVLRRLFRRVQNLAHGA